MMLMLEELLNKYAEQFGDNFPIFAVKGMDEDEIIKLIQSSLDEDKQYEPEYLDGVDY
jgi:2-oxo-4-hydroxy-4-carboxy--5-ureidoimidazoline (OHCU) decarboxylase